MGDVTAVNMDVVTDKSGHVFTPCAVSVCITPAAPAPLPIPYPVVGSTSDGATAPAIRTSINGAKVITVGSVFTACHGNEAGTLKEVVSLNTGGPCLPLIGAPTVLTELGMQAITGSFGIMNKGITVGPGGSTSGASGGAGSASGGGGAGGGAGGNKPPGPSGGGGSGGGGSGSGASAPTQAEKDLAAQPNANPDDGKNAARVTAREKVVRDFYEGRPGLGQQRADQDMGVGGSPPRANGNPKGYGIDLQGPVKVVDIPPPPKMEQYVKKHGNPGNFFDPVGGQSGDKLGLNDDPAIRKSTTFNTPVTNPKQQGLVSQNGPIVDDWTDPNNPVQTKGGGTQMTVDDDTKKGFDPQPQPW